MLIYLLINENQDEFPLSKLMWLFLPGVIYTCLDIKVNHFAATFFNLSYFQVPHFQRKYKTNKERNVISIYDYIYIYIYIYIYGVMYWKEKYFSETA